MTTRRIVVELHDGADAPRRVEVHGREAWALSELLTAGQNGATPIDRPGPRWSSYVHKLRRRGFAIETLRESHGGPFPGSHARYLLRSKIQILEIEDEKVAA